jgi:hypothetical protein
MARVSLPTASEARPVSEPNVEEVTWRAEAVFAGALGAGVVALFFLAIDVAAGRPLWTPFVLGSALFLGSLPAPGAAIDLVIVAGYTAVHALVFVTFAAMAAFHFDTETRPRVSAARVAAVALLLFVAFELCFVVFARLFVPATLETLGLVRISAANALASVAMAAWLARRAARGVGLRDMGPPPPG